MITLGILLLVIALLIFLGAGPLLALALGGIVLVGVPTLLILLGGALLLGGAAAAAAIAFIIIL